MIQQDFSLKAFENTGRFCVPHILLAGLLLLNIAALPLWPENAVKPQFVLMAVYYWAIYRPTLMPPLLCFALGLMMDIMTGMTPGVNALILVLTHWMVREQRRFLMGQPYSTIWAVFGLVSALSVLAQWALYGLAQLYWDALLPGLGGALLSMLLFPFITIALVMAHRMLPVASRPYP